MDPTFSVLVGAPPLPSVESAAKVIARFTGGVVFDARRTAKLSWGFLGERLSQSDAERLASLAGEEGISARLVPSEKIVHLPEPLPARRFRFIPQGLAFVLGTRTEELLAPWERVRILSALPLKETHSFVKVVKEGPTAEQRAVGMGIMMVTGIPLGMGKSKEVKKVLSETDLFLYMDVFVQTPGGLRRLHVEADKFDYFPALGEARRPDQLGNFRLLLKSLDDRSGPALRNHGVQGFLSGASLSHLGYDTADDYEKELRWLATLQSL